MSSRVVWSTTTFIDPNKFSNDFVNYFEKNNLTNIGLQFLGAIKIGGYHTRSTDEFELGENGTITLHTDILKDVELVHTS